MEAWLLRFFEKKEELKDGDEFDLRLLINFDETVIGGEKSQENVAKQEGDDKECRNINKDEEHITLVLTTTALGHSFTPIVIFGRKTDPLLNDNIRSKFHISASDSAFINKDICQNWVENSFIEEINNHRAKIGKPNNPVLIVHDSHKSRNSIVKSEILEVNRIYLFPIPAHFSAVLQPLDLASNGKLKRFTARFTS